MKTIFLFCILFCSFTFAQDTLIFGAAPQDSIQLNSPDLSLFRGDCAHGHECCSAGCSCCTELKRPQVYDTAIYFLENGSKRYEIFERYFYAAWHAPSAIQYPF